MSSALHGTWRLVSALVEFVDTGERVDMYGPNPSGRLVMAENGRMITLLAAGERSADDPAGAFNGMMGYSGTYRVEGNRVTTTVDVAWHPDFVGTEQVRFFGLEGDTFHVRTETISHPKFPGRSVIGILEWRRER